MSRPPLQQIVFDPDVPYSQQFKRFGKAGIIGSGSLGRVSKQVHIPTGIEVAMKTMEPTYDDEVDVAEEAFNRERRVLGNIDHPNVVGLHGSFVHSHDGDIDNYHLALEHLEGWTLQEAIDGNGTRGPKDFSKSEQREILARMMAGLDAIHTAGAGNYVHRDLKPGNIMLVKPEGYTDPEVTFDRVVILDPGIAKVDAKATAHASVFIGTPAWLAPEQRDRDRFGRETAKTDLYTAAHIAVALNTGIWPTAPRHVFAPQEEDEYQPLHSLEQGTFSRPLKLTLERMLQLDPKDRPESARAVVAFYEAAQRARVPEVATQTSPTPRQDDLEGRTGSALALRRDTSLIEAMAEGPEYDFVYGVGPVKSPVGEFVSDLTRTNVEAGSNSVPKRLIGSSVVFGAAIYALQTYLGPIEWQAIGFGAVCGALADFGIRSPLTYLILSHTKGAKKIRTFERDYETLLTDIWPGNIGEELDKAAIKYGVPCRRALALGYALQEMKAGLTDQKRYDNAAIVTAREAAILPYTLE